MSQGWAYINAHKVKRLRNFFQERWIASSRVSVSDHYPGRINFNDRYIDYARVVAKTREEAMARCEAEVLRIHERDKEAIEEQKRKMREDYAQKSVRLD